MPRVIRYAAAVALLLLQACSGASRTCDDASGYCMLTLRDGGAGTSVTAAIVLAPDGHQITSGVLGAVGAGWTAQVNPLAALAPPAATAAAGISKGTP